MRSSCLVSVDVREFYTVGAHSCSGATSDKYSITKQSRVEKYVMVRIEGSILTDWEKMWSARIWKRSSKLCRKVFASAPTVIGNKPFKA
jgi:hypothetical protein